MQKYLQILHLALSLMPWIKEAEAQFGEGNGDQKKAFVTSACEAAGDALMKRFGVPETDLDELHELIGEAIDMGVHLAHFKGIFKASTTVAEGEKYSQHEAAHLALTQPIPAAPFLNQVQSPKPFMS